MGVINLVRQTLANTATPGATKTALTIDSATGQLLLKNDSGASVLVPGVPGQNPPGGNAALITTPATFGAVETLINNASLPANSLIAGTSLHVAAFGTVSAASAGTLLGRLRIGTAGTTADTQILATAATGAAVAAVGWYFDAFTTVRSISAGGTIIGNASLTVGTTPSITTQTAAVTVNTTVANFLDVTFIGGGTTPVVTVVQSIIEVVKS